MRVIPIVRDELAVPYMAVLDDVPVRTGPLLDRLGRPLRDLRISVTDRCNFRCAYCMPKAVFDRDHRFLPQSDLLSFEEIFRLASQFVTLGVRKIRLTGGEPLLRKNLERLIEGLATLRTPEGDELDLTLTTNGSLLSRKAQSLKDAGLKRITVSLDALDDAVFRQMNDVDYPVSKVLEGIETAQAVGFSHIKVNMVVKKGTNDHEILPMARHFMGSGISLRFIEYMDVGSTNQWRMDEVLPGSQVVNHINAQHPLVQLAPTIPGETSDRWGYAGPDGRHDSALGEIGVICSVTQAFCGECNRARLSTDGRLFQCLFGSAALDLRSLMRSGEPISDEQISSTIRAVWRNRTDRYSEIRGAIPEYLATPIARNRPEMSYIGG
ncbi:MAG: cyclic pyranopterin phosphate synthase [Curvibacter sp. GWA2_64_110]|nr:MAG: cyclic pyranopterin phosphate synthase [Curvibacter sp. GWA2_64_110]HCY15447.1 GTP 3',8-cyclase MoaA [Curvibacter sp.]